MRRCLVACLLMLLSLPCAWTQQPEWFAQARSFLQQGNWRAAKDLAERALAQNPQEANAEMLLGLIATAQSQFPEAGKHFARAAQLQPKNLQAHAYLGSAYLHQQRLAEAEESFQQVLALDDANAAAHYNLGLIALQQGRLKDALPHFERVTADAPDDVAARMGLLETQLRSKDKAGAKQTAEQLHRLVPAGDPRLLQIGGLLAANAQYDAAIVLFEKARAGGATGYESNFNLALAYLRAGRLDEAAGAASSLLKLAQPGQAAEVQSLLAAINAARERPAEALAAFRKAAELQPANEEYRFDYANFLLQSNLTEEAVQAFQAGVKDFPKSWKMLSGLGGSLYVGGHFEEAAQALLRSLQMQPAAAVTLDLLGKSYEAVGDTRAEIRRVFEQQVNAHPNDPLASYYLGNILYLEARAHEHRDFQKAAALFRKAIEMDPDFARAHLALGILYQEEKKFPESVKALERAARLAPDLTAVHYRLGQVYQQTGETEKAKAEIALFQKLKAEGADARETAATLNQTKN